MYSTAPASTAPGVSVAGKIRSAMAARVTRSPRVSARPSLRSWGFWVDVDRRDVLAVTGTVRDERGVRDYGKRSFRPLARRGRRVAAALQPGGPAETRRHAGNPWR